MSSKLLKYIKKYANKPEKSHILQNTQTKFSEEESEIFMP